MPPKENKQGLLDSLSSSFGDSSRKVIRKVIVLGDCSVGKTTYIRRYMWGDYGQDYKTTIGGRIIDFRKEEFFLYCMGGMSGVAVFYFVQKTRVQRSDMVTE